MSQPEPVSSTRTTRYLDCRDEVTPYRSTQNDHRGWHRESLSDSDWLFRFDEDARAEIHRSAEIIALHPVDQLLRTPVDLNLQHCRKHYKKLRKALTQGVGFCVADRLPVDDYPVATMVEVYWVLSQMIGRPVAQKRNGQMIYDVKDTARKYEYGVRGSWTNVELNFHTDNAFGKCPPDFVSLFCKQPAKTGGVSRFCSLYSLHTALEQKFPQALRRLYQPMLFDRQKEHLDGEPAVSLAPFFSWRNDSLRARANPSLVRKGHNVAGVAIAADLEDALAAVDEVSSATELWYEAALEKGQIQYLNNAEVGHYRSEFSDFDEPDRKRHLYRLWHRDEGSISYDGVSLTN